MLGGSLLRPMFVFALPLIATGILQQSFNSVDVAVLGRFVGSHALAAVGSCGPVVGLIINLFMGLAVGVNVVVANFIGQGKADNVRKAIGASWTLALASGVLLLVIGESMCRPLLELLGTPENVIDDAERYMRIFVCGLPFMMLYNFGASILRSVGDTRSPFYSLVASGIINVLLNLLFVIKFDMGVAGVAWATVISNFVSAGIIIVILLRDNSDIRLVISEVRPNFPQMRKIIGIGAPAGIQGAVFALSNMLILSGINSFGANATAGSAAAINYEFYCYFVISAFAQTALAFMSQNYGAGNFDRIRRIFRYALLMSVTLTFILNVVIVWQRGFFLSIFTTDPATLVYARERVACVLMFQWIACYYEIAAAAMRALGRSMTPTLIVIFGTCVLRVLWVLIILPRIGGEFYQLMTVYPVSWIVTDIIMGIAYKKVARRQLSEATQAGVQN